ncbi:hypothetical protein N7493_009909 [Penicillium malachiteum]|uniref:WW domain-containing protein n=1 Tax=Penicillium malachiteum TaxID=1324776 RepID=A0AAD6HE07_9EURO|nr:hypothetical protein N7493_009909 [Penicillium malachiteum]
MSAPFAPPPGPPPPAVPEGWKAQYDERYQTWFYVHLATGKSQWEVPEAPAAGIAPPGNAPPSYDQTGPSDPAIVASAGDKKRPLSSNNPYNPRGTSSPSIDSDAQLAAKLQAEEDARASSRSPGARGAASDYYSGNAPITQLGTSGSYAGPSSNVVPEEKSRSKGFLSKLMGKSSSSRPRPQAAYASYPQQQQGYGDPNYGRYPQGYAYGGYPQQSAPYYQQQQYQQQPQRKHGMGTAGAAALGVGGGLLGGLLLADAVEDLGDHHDYNDGGWGGGPGPGDGGGWDDGGGGFDGGGDFGGGGDF